MRGLTAFLGRELEEQGMQGHSGNTLERAPTPHPGDLAWALPHLSLITSPATLGLRVL